jgi:hypothetical protein
MIAVLVYMSVPVYVAILVIWFYLSIFVFLSTAVGQIAKILRFVSGLTCVVYSFFLYRTRHMFYSHLYLYQINLYIYLKCVGIGRKLVFRKYEVWRELTHVYI